MVAGFGHGEFNYSIGFGFPVAGGSEIDSHFEERSCR